MAISKKYHPDSIPAEYEIHADGKIYSSLRYERRELAQFIGNRGYPYVRLVVNGKRTHYMVHSLVANKYLESRPSPEHEVCHNDGDKTNNAASNLRWGTKKENAADRERHGHTLRGEALSHIVKEGMRRAGFNCRDDALPSAPQLRKCLHGVASSAPCAQCEQEIEATVC